MHEALNKIYIITLIEIAFNVSENKLFPNTCIIASALDRITVGR
jgi:hypothetical protein